MAVAQNRIVEKAFLVDHGIAVGPHVAAPTDITPAQLRRARELAQSGAVVKTAQFGYDGKGQRRVSGAAELAAALTEFAGRDCIVEALLDLRAEVSVVIARTAVGTLDSWPVTENVHVDGILDVSVAPARITDELAARAKELAVAVANELDYVGRARRRDVRGRRRRAAGERGRTATRTTAAIGHSTQASRASSNSRSVPCAGSASATRR